MQVIKSHYFGNPSSVHIGTYKENRYRICFNVVTMSLSCEDHAAYICWAFFHEDKMYLFSQDACIFNNQIFFESKFYLHLKIHKFTMHVNAYPECTNKYTEKWMSKLRRIHLRIRRCSLWLAPVFFKLAQIGSICPYFIRQTGQRQCAIGSPFPRNLTKLSNYCRQMCYKNVFNSNKSIPLSMVMRMDIVGNV